MDKLLKTLEYNKIIEKLTNQALTTTGKELCETLTPSYDYDEISKNLAQTQEAVNIILRYETPQFSGIHDIRTAIKRAEISSTLTAEELLNIADTLRGSKKLKNLADSLDENFPKLSEYFNALYQNTGIENAIYQAIDNTDHISDHASPALYQIRQKIKSEEINIKEKINAIIRGSSYSKYLQENIVTLRNDRYVIPVKQEYRSHVPGLVHDSSSTGSTLFIEPIAVVEANNRIHELYLQEKVEIENILTELSTKIWQITEELTILVKNLAKLDFIFAKAKLSIQQKAFAPNLNKNGYVNLKKARHPLILDTKVVPIDIWFGKDFRSLIITGPNTGGKTVTLKTVGLLTLMAYSGLFIPALDNSDIAVFDNIYADIGDEQSIEQSLSTFSSHMTNIISIYKTITPNSLILLDELGSGTDPVEGSALAVAILEDLYKLGCRTIASTHYSELKTYALTTPGIKNASCEFDVNTLNPTYKLTIGLPGKSNAFAISKKLGLSEYILENAKKFIDNEQAKFEDIISELQKDRQTLEQQRDKTQKELTEIEQLKKELAETKAKLEEQKTKILAKAREEATEILLDAEETAKETMKEIKEAQKLKYNEMNKKFDNAKSKIKKQLSKTYKKSEDTETPYTPFEVKIGMNVYVPSLDQEASVLSLPDSDQYVQIQAGIVKSKLHISKLRPTKQPQATVNNVKISISSKVQAQNISSEIMLRHMHVDEALYELEKYIDHALIANLSTIRIVHGKGEGILRKAVHEFLKNHPNIKSYRLGDFGEGDLGVTIAELK